MAKLLQAVLHIVLLCLCGATALVEYDVVCDHTNATCYCPQEDASGRIIEVCNFVLDVDLIQTFTRYELEKTSRDSRGTAGRVWYIDEAGQEQVHPQGGACSDATADCTEAFYVDGFTFRSFIAVNSRIPAPTIIVNEDQLVHAVVNNRLASQTTSIHWHGMHQRNSNWMDGVERVTQCGIAPGANLTYIFRATPPGTHWYHSHSGAQRTDGMFGSLIVLEKDITSAKAKLGEFEDNPAEHTLSLVDWQFSNSIDLFTKIHASIRLFEDENGNAYRGDQLGQNLAPTRTESLDGAETGPITYWSGLINGKGRHSTVNYTQTRLSIFTVSPDGTFRFRLVGAQNLYAFRVSVDEHKLRLIATDGVFVNHTTPVDFIVVHTGERYDFLLETKSAAEVASKSNFMIRAETLEVLPSGTVNSAVAILHYNTSDPPVSTEYEAIDANSVSVVSTCTADNMCIAINCPFQNYPSSYYINCVNIHQLRLLEPFSGDLPDADVGSSSNQLFFNFGFEGSRQTSAINGRNLKLPASPLVQSGNMPKDICDLSEAISAECDQNVDAIISPNCFCTHIKELDGNVYIQLVLSAVGPDPEVRTNFAFSHPIHLHGHYFHVVDVQYGTYDSNQSLVRGRDEIDCGPNSQVLCTHPSWANGQGPDYSVGSRGKIDPLAPLKDTVIVPFGGYVVTYFKTDNPGFWFLHCHIEAHQLEGMALILREGETSTHISPPTDFPTCGDFSFSVDEYLDAISGQGPGPNQCNSDGWMATAIVFIILTIILVFLLVASIVAIVCLCIKKNNSKV